MLLVRSCVALPLFNLLLLKDPFGLNTLIAFGFGVAVYHLRFSAAWAESTT